jgi:phage baseplate assembly protein W
MAVYSFKSSGVTQQTTPANNLTVTPTPIGIVTPLTLGDNDLLRTNTDLATQLGDNLKNLIQTNWGERLGLYNYGANLRPLLSNIVAAEDFDSQAITAIKNSVSRWMPYIDLVDFVSDVDQVGKLTKGIAQISIVVSYNIPSLNVKGKKIKVTLFAI